jgi:two-component system NtrC family sensor kinase
VWSGEGPAGGTPWGNTARSARAAVHAPLVKEGRVLGVLGVFSYAGPYSDEDVRLFESLADQAAVAVENALLDRRVSESEARFREVLASIERMVGHAVVITGLDGRIQYAGGTETVHGYAPEELVGRDVSALGRNVPEAAEISEDFLAAVRRGEPWTRAVTATRRSGENFPILISASPYFGSGGEMSGVVTIGVDLTEQVEGERRLMQSAKLAAIGELVAGVAHELNNPLTVVKTTATLLEAELSGEAAADARAIREHADRAARIVRGLLHFARRTPPERLPTDLNQVVARVCAFRQDGLRAGHVALETRLAPDLPLTLADGPQLEQVVLNLVNNAEQAIASARGRGRVTLSTEAGEGVLRFRVADDGPGIPEEVRARVFDPFFTTRAVGEGTGLGLAVSHGIVAEHGGSITVRSEPGAGAAFTVEIPLVPVPEEGAAPPAARRRAGAVPGPAAGAGGGRRGGAAPHRAALPGGPRPPGGRGGLRRRGAGAGRRRRVRRGAAGPQDARDDGRRAVPHPPRAPPRDRRPGGLRHRRRDLPRAQGVPGRERAAGVREAVRPGRGGGGGGRAVRKCVSAGVRK